MKAIAPAGILVLLSLAAPPPVPAQPSGGPYGPIPQAYPVPEAEHVHFVAPDGSAGAPGTLEQPTTLQAAFSRVVTNDAIVLRGGVYRIGGLVLNQGITMQPHEDERPVLKGTRVATEWTPLRDGVWRTSWPTLFPAEPLGWWRRGREGMRTPLHRFNNDMVLVDGESLRSAGWEGELDEHSFYIDYQAGHVYIGVDPRDRLVEITAWNNAFIRTTRPAHGKAPDKKGPTIRGLTFTQYAYRAIDIEARRPAAKATEEPTDDPVGLQEPGTYGREVVGTTLENVTISHCSRVAGYFRGDGLVIRNSLVSDTSTEGIYVIGSSDVLLERNIIRRNNVEQLTGYYPAAVKIFNQSHRVTCRDNLVLDNPHSNGIWYDVGNHDGVFVNNWVENAQDGFFFEISDGALCAGNVFVGCRNGIHVLNAANVRAYHNTLVNSPARFWRTERSAEGDHFGWHASTAPPVDGRDGHVFVANLVVADEAHSFPLLQTVQSAALCGRLTEPQLKHLDGNVYVRRGSAVEPLVLWSPAEGENCRLALDALDDLRSLQPGFAVNSLSLSDYVGALFRSPELQRYELGRSLPVSLDGLVPAEIYELLGWGKSGSPAPGAYPSGR